MSLKKEDAIRRIGRYLNRNDSHPRLVNANNPKDLDSILQVFSVGNNIFKAVSDFSIEDENLLEDALYNFLREVKGVVFLTGFTSYYRLLGEQKLQDFINRLAGISLSGLHLVLLCYQCEKYLAKIDQRYSQFVYMIEGREAGVPQLIFVMQDMPVPAEETIVEGVQNIAAYIEQSTTGKLFVHTGKKKLSYPLSLYTIKEFNNSYGVLCSIDSSTMQLKESYGTAQDWAFALTEITRYGSWAKYITNIFTTTTNLEIAIGCWTSFDDRKKWLYFVALKLYGAKNSWCLNDAVNHAESSTLLVRNVFRSLLHIPHMDKDFWNHYDERKNIIHTLGNPDSEVADYCAMVKSKGKDALYYLTDASKREKDLIFENLALYSEEIGRSRVIEALSHVYPALFSYLQPYCFKIPQLDLDSYFQEYKYQKVVNKVFPEFLKFVNDQAEKREFNLWLPARSEKLDAINKEGTAVYFMDAMGVEYLSYVMDQCRRRKLMAYTTICHCELPSITSFNKEFIDVFTEGGSFFVPNKNGIKSLDDLKHHGEKEFDFTNNEIPTYISRELDIISETIKKIETLLVRGEYKRVVIISDHGASRLCVLSKKENKWGSESNAEHSGRCCPISEIDEQPSCATEENGYWVLANYDRFKGGRMANIEVHGGATLEEVVVPIIEIVYSPDEIEIQVLDKNIKFSRRKKDAVIRIFSKIKIDNLSIRIPGLNAEYEGKSTDGQMFTIALPGLRRAGKYTMDVYYNNNLLKRGLEFTAENVDFSERKLL